jgi:hypothetical protein
MKITEALMAEHLVFHSMFDQIEARTPELKTLAEVKALAAILESMLKAHSDIEDELFLGPLEHCFEQIGQRDCFLEEHQEVNDGLQVIQTATRIKQLSISYCARWLTAGDILTRKNAWSSRWLSEYSRPLP